MQKQITNTFVETRPEHQPIPDTFRADFEQAANRVDFGEAYAVTGRIMEGMIHTGNPADYVTVIVKAAVFGSEKDHDAGTVKVHGWRPAQ